MILAITNLLPPYLLQDKLLEFFFAGFCGSKGGIAVLFGPTGGYILGFIPAAFVVGWLLEKGWYKNLLACLLFLPGDLLKLNLRVIPFKI